MGQQLVKQLLTVLDKIKWPEVTEATQLGRTAYEVGLEKVDEFRNDPKSLASAITTFQSGQSRPYAFAGVAYTLIRASRESDGSYTEQGLAAALEWLERAQELAPDVLEINIMEAFVYVYSARFDDARLILDYLEAIDATYYYVLVAEIAYWQQQRMIDETVYWYERAISVADTLPRKFRLRNNMADCLLEFGRYQLALRAYVEVQPFAKENPWLWHNMSVAYWHLEEYKEAWRCNKRALALADLPDARLMQTELKQKVGTGSLTDRLLGR
jgi:tetratricopeptide (TPR) repeat protein